MRFLKQDQTGVHVVQIYDDGIHSSFSNSSTAVSAAWLNSAMMSFRSRCRQGGPVWQRQATSTQVCNVDAASVVKPNPLTCFAISRPFPGGWTKSPQRCRQRSYGPSRAMPEKCNGRRGYQLEPRALERRSCLSCYGYRMSRAKKVIDGRP